MNPMPLVTQIYLLCTGVGSIVLVLMAAMGATHGHGAHAHGGHAGHAGAGHGHTGGGHGHTGGGRGPATTAGHGVQTGSHAAPTGSHSAPTGSHGSSAAHSHAASSHASASADGSELAKALPAKTTSLPAVREDKQQRAATLLLTLLNPTTLSMFLITFGGSGTVISTFFPLIPLLWTIPLALCFALFLTKLGLAGLGAVTALLYQNSSFSQQTLIGAQAEVTVSFDGNKTGEVTCVAGGPRYTLSAKINHPGLSFKRGDRVIICNLEDDVAYVEPISAVDPLNDVFEATVAPEVSEEIKG